MMPEDYDYLFNIAEPPAKPGGFFLADAPEFKYSESI